MIAFTPKDPNSALDRRGAEQADYIFNRVYLNARACACSGALLARARCRDSGAGGRR
jgi:hypothetical protein